jgi:hypothetical protein
MLRSTMRKTTFWLFILIWGLSAAVSHAAPDSLHQIILNVNPHQIVGHPLVGPASVLLLDENGALIPDYDLAANPIVLHCESGVLVPDTISNPAWFSGGVVNLQAAQIRYFGNTGLTALVARTPGAESSPALISFSGYDIDEVVGISPDTLSRVYANSGTGVHVRVTNRGDQIADSQPNLRASFFSSGSSNEVTFAASANGLVDELEIDLPTTGLPSGPDTLCLTLQSV